MEKHDLGVGRNLGGKVDFVMTDPPYNLRGDQMDHHTEYDAFSSSNRIDTANLAEDVMKTKAHRHMFFQLYEVLFPTKPLFLG